jgi:hypothetical protein
VDEARMSAMLAALAHAEGGIRVELGGLGLRRLPHLVFARDREFERGERVLAILEELQVTEPEAELAGPPPDTASGEPVPGPGGPGTAA